MQLGGTYSEQWGGSRVRDEATWVVALAALALTACDDVDGMGGGDDAGRVSPYRDSGTFRTVDGALGSFERDAGPVFGPVVDDPLWEVELERDGVADGGAACSWLVPDAPDFDTTVCRDVRIRGADGVARRLCPAITLSGCDRCAGHYSEGNGSDERLVLCPETCNALGEQPEASVWFAYERCTVP